MSNFVVALICKSFFRWGMVEAWAWHSEAAECNSAHCHDSLRPWCQGDEEENKESGSSFSVSVLISERSTTIHPYFLIWVSPILNISALNAIVSVLLQN